MKLNSVSFFFFDYTKNFKMNAENAFSMWSRCLLSPSDTFQLHLFSLLVVILFSIFKIYFSISNWLYYCCPMQYDAPHSWCLFIFNRVVDFYSFLYFKPSTKADFPSSESINSRIFIIKRQFLGKVSSFKKGISLHFHTLETHFHFSQNTSLEVIFTTLHWKCNFPRSFLEKSLLWRSH